VTVSVLFPPVVPGDAIRVSASTYVTFKRCPEQAAARLQGVYGPDTRPAFVGSLAHRIFSRHLASGAIQSEDFARVCKEEIGGSGLNNKLGALGNKPSELNAVIEEVRALYERFVKLPEEGFEGAEHSIEANPAEGVSLVGTVDAVYREDLGGHRLVDWKTGELGDPNDQLMFYALLWTLEHDELPAYVEAISVRTGERYKSVPSSVEMQATADDVGGMVSSVRESWTTGSAMPRTAGPWCRYCPVLPDCDEGKSAGALLDGRAPAD
jgi:hypothetical protein